MSRFDGSEGPDFLKCDDPVSLAVFAVSLPGLWNVKVSWADMVKHNAHWLYFFRTGPSADASPVFVVRRMGGEYVVTVFDVVVWLNEGELEAFKFATIGEVISAIRAIVDELEMEEPSGCTWDRMAGSVAMASGPNVGVFPYETCPGRSLDGYTGIFGGD